MTTKQRLELAQSERRSKLNTLAGKDELTDEERTSIDALSAEYADGERQLRAAIIAEDAETRDGGDQGGDQGGGDGEQAEVRRLIDKASAARILDNILSGQVQDGPESELQKHYGAPADAIPLALLEDRAAATITGDTQGNQRPIRGQLFPAGIAAYLGVDEERVPVGEGLYPVLTTGASVGTPAKGATQAETTGAFTVKTLTPKRVQATFSYALEDAAKFRALDEALRANLRGALQSKLDEQVLNRGTDGLLTFGTAPDAPSAMSDPDDFISAMYSAVDGTNAQTVSDVRLAVGSTIYSFMATLFKSSSNDSVLDTLLRRAAGGVRVSAHVPAYASNFQSAVTVAGPGNRNAVAAIWETGIRIIEDRVTKADEGEVRLVAVMLADHAILRQAAYSRYSFRTIA